ncbi:hypothetical protein B9Z19DRAFT_1153018 [Tuber borchii]|uniref:Uncharacterized protein n=1 Tax=Tuber borchii TaxID=42251 RepID=A0A2T6ZJC6_TUBBO|nr:hypothetical protein B9Z19DRAFT_1153018 [Tuber borchii]
MPVVSQFPIKDLLSQVNKCEKMENKGGDASDLSLVIVVGLAVTLVALFLAITSYYQRWPFNHPAPSLVPSPFVKACPHPLPLSWIMLTYSQPRNPLQQASKTHLPNHSTTIPPPNLARVNQFFFFNDSSNAPFAGANLGAVTLSYQNNGMSRGDMRVA